MTESSNRQDRLSTIFVTTGSQELSPAQVLTYTTIRTMVKDPTISIARNFAAAPVLISNWSVAVLDDKLPDAEKAKQFITDQVLPWRLRFLERALYGTTDYGWAPFEIVYGEDDGMVVLEKIKPLLQDITTILINGKTGAFSGFLQTDDVTIQTDKALLVAINVEGTMWYGKGWIENIYEPFTSWNDANDGAKRYDMKVAGSHFVVYYPPGNCLDGDGDEVTNAVMAGTILDALESSGSISVPTTILEHIQDLNQVQASQFEWKITILEDKEGKQPTFIERLKYLDTLKARGLNMPERTIFEGSHGTKSESETHASAALSFMDFLHLYLTEVLNRMLVDHLLAANFGREYIGKVVIVPAPLVNARKSYLEKVYTVLLSRMKDTAEISNIDMGTLKDLIEVPRTAGVKEVKVKEDELPGAGGDANETE